MKTACDPTDSASGPGPVATTSGVRRRQSGITLVESLIVLAITAIVLGASLPGYELARERRHLQGAAAQLETDIHFVRSLAVAHDRLLRLSFVNDGAASCYVVHGGAAITDCSCADTGAAACSARPQTWRVVRFDGGMPVQLRANVKAIVFDPHQGTSTPTATMRFVGRSGAEVRAVVSLMGRVRQCAPAPGMPGLPAC